MPKLRVFLKYWLPVLLWMALIFSASADTNSYQHSSRLVEPLLLWLFPKMPPARVEELHHLFRKCGHLTEYAVLALLLWRMIHRPDKKIRARGTGRKPASRSRLFFFLQRAMNSIKFLCRSGRRSFRTCSLTPPEARRRCW